MEGTPRRVRCLFEDFQAEQSDEVDKGDLEAPEPEEGHKEVENDICGDTGSGMDQNSDEDLARFLQ
jgi:hypothetical protein